MMKKKNSFFLQKKGGICGMQRALNIKTDIRSLGTDIAALLRNAYIACHLSKLAHNYIQDT